MQLEALHFLEIMLKSMYSLESTGGGGRGEGEVETEFLFINLTTMNVL